MRTDDQHLVKRLRLFADMEDGNFADLMQVAYLQTFPRQVQLITEGEAADFLHVVVAGSVELFARSNGRETTMEVVRPVATFILAAVLIDAVYLMSARTLEKSRVLLIPAENIRAVRARDRHFDKAIIAELATRYRAVVKAQKDLKLRTGAERLANYLLREHGKQGRTGTLRLTTDKRTLAGRLGMTPENLSRAFASLGPCGVEVNGTAITLTSPEDLAALAKPNPLIDEPDI